MIISYDGARFRVPFARLLVLCFRPIERARYFAEMAVQAKEIRRFEAMFRSQFEREVVVEIVVPE